MPAHTGAVVPLHAGRARSCRAGGVAGDAAVPPRPCPDRWPTTTLDREQASALLLAAPFRVESRGAQRQRARCLGQVLDWLASQPGATWQERWATSGVESSADWREAAVGWLTATGRFLPSDRQSRGLGAGLLLLICGDVIRPGPGWLLASSGLRLLTAEMARTRDPAASRCSGRHAKRGRSAR